MPDPDKARAFEAMDRLLVTGATGFLGGAIAAQLLQEGRIEETLLLVRAATPAEGLQRIAERLRLFGVAEDIIATLSERNVLLGDLANFPAADPRLQQVTAVINCAAVASFGDHPRIWSTNVDHTLAFARQASVWPGLRRFLHVGTAMSCGMQAPSPVPEDYDAGDKAEHVVSYTESKAAVEARMRSELPDLPLVVARPSIVVGHTRLGCKPSPSIFWVFRMGLAMRMFLCAPEDRIDVIPVDYCASALLALARKPVLKYDRYHIAAGEAGSCNFREIESGIAEALGVPPMDDYRQVGMEEISALQPRFQELFGRCIPWMMLRAIELYGGFASLDIIFANSHLLAEGIAPPPRFTDYIANCALTAAGGTIAEQMMVDFK